MYTFKTVLIVIFGPLGNRIISQLGEKHGQCVNIAHFTHPVENQSL